MDASTDQLTKLFGVSRQTIGVWKKKGMDVAFISKGKWDLFEVITWWCENVWYPKNSQGISDNRARWERGRADKIEFENDVMKSKYYPKTYVDSAFAELIGVTKRKFLLLPTHAPTLLSGCGVGSMQDAIDVLQNSVDEILISMAENITTKEAELRLLACNK